MSSTSHSSDRASPGAGPGAGTIETRQSPKIRVLEGLEDSLSTIENAGLRPGLVDELATVIRIIHGSLGLDEGGLR